MRLKNIPDQEVVKFIKAEKYEILPSLFERNLVNALNIGDKLELEHKVVYGFLANSVVLIWQYFSSKPWLAAKHKIDFIIDYSFRYQLNAFYPEANLKLKYNFEDFNPSIKTLIEEEKGTNGPVINNFKVLKERTKSILWLSYFENLLDDTIADRLGITDEKVEKERKKGVIKWTGLLVQNLKFNLDPNIIEEHFDEFYSYYKGSLTEQQSLDVELLLSNNKNIQSGYNQFEELLRVIVQIRRKNLVEYTLNNASTKLTGNIWGNKISIASAIFIAVVGLLVWYADSLPEDNKDIFNLEETPIDSLRNKSNYEDSI